MNSFCHEIQVVLPNPDVFNPNKNILGTNGFGLTKFDCTLCAKAYSAQTSDRQVMAASILIPIPVPMLLSAAFLIRRGAQQDQSDYLDRWHGR